MIDTKELTSARLIDAGRSEVSFVDAAKTDGLKASGARDLRSALPDVARRGRHDAAIRARLANATPPRTIICTTTRAEREMATIAALRPLAL